MKIYLFVFFTVFFLVTFILPSWRVFRKTGINPFVVPNDDTVFGFVGLVFKVLIILVFLVVAIRAFIPSFYQFLAPVSYLELSLLQSIGWVVLHLGFILILVAQWQMQLSWRIGIDEKNHTEMVTKGLFSFSRNPIFLGLLFTLFGLFFILPSAITLLTAILSWMALQVQVRLEEEFLEKRHGAIYVNYKKNVRRWI